MMIIHLCYLEEVARVSVGREQLLQSLWRSLHDTAHKPRALRLPCRKHTAVYFGQHDHVRCAYRFA